MKVIGIDTGGTFTDVITLDIATGVMHAAKALTVRGDESKGIKACLKELNVSFQEIERLVHGTTIGTNAILERRGAKTAVLTTRGFRDLLELGQTRRMAPNTLFELTFRRPEPLVPRSLRFDVDERMLASGKVREPLNRESLSTIAKELAVNDIQSLAICYLHSYANPSHEHETRNFLKDHLSGISASLSHEIVPEYREFERLTTTVLNAYIAPLMKRYLDDLEALLENYGQLYVMSSNGGVLSAASAKHYPVQTVLSGPAGGITASVLIGESCGLEHMITCDMGGTSTDVCMVHNLKPEVKFNNLITGIPIKLAQVDIHTVGAGGGSIAKVDPEGQLHVGPQSAGSTPGPISYGLGGTEITVTDANLLLGRLSAQKALGGKIIPSTDGVLPVMQKLADEVGVSGPKEIAAGIVRLAVTKMVTTIREISIARGHDPREYVLVAFGGAGPMHATQIADELKMNDVLIPPFAGNLSALGLMASDIRHDLTETILGLNTEETMDRIDKAIERLRDQGRRRLTAEGFSEKEHKFECELEIRYRGQAFEIRLPIKLEKPDPNLLLAEFHDAYAGLYGHANQDQEIEIVNARMIAQILSVKPRVHSPSAKGEPLLGRRVVYFDVPIDNVPIYDRQYLSDQKPRSGPAIIEESGATTVVFPDWTFRRDEFDNLRLKRE